MWVRIRIRVRCLVAGPLVYSLQLVHLALRDDALQEGAGMTLQEGTGMMMQETRMVGMGAGWTTRVPVTRGGQSSAGAEN